MKKKGFTLIELIAVLVIMAILALIVTPLVMSIIRKVRVSADKRSIDAYGRSIELAVASYLLDTGKFPTDLSQLTIEYSGNRVECSTTQLNPDSSVYLTGCTVGGKSVDYAYGEDKNPPTYEVYNVGDEVTYNGVDYYVIKNSGEQEESITLLKAEPLTVAEVNTYGGVGTANNHVNRYINLSKDTAFNKNGYGGMAYYTSETCGYSGNSGCTTYYEQSEIKYIVDAWATDKTDNSDLVEDATGYKVRLITYEELTTNLGYIATEGTRAINSNSEVPNFIYNNNYSYWTMSAYDNSRYAWFISEQGLLHSYNTVNTCGTVRPVIVLSKSAISS